MGDTKNYNSDNTERISNGMESENKNIEKPNPYAIPIAIVIAGAMIAGTLATNKPNVSISDARVENQKNLGDGEKTVSVLGEETILPSLGVVLPVSWGDLGQKLVSVGAIDSEKFKALYETRAQFSDEYKNLLFGNDSGKLKITEENAPYLLNLFWALGLASKNPILEQGEMANPKYGGAQNFASTAGWTIAQGNPMDHYSRHKFFNLTPEEQALVDKISRGIYRPCCGNAVHFPDCNHGMAMLGLLELMASQGVSEADMWKVALTVNSYWFPDTYLTIATYMKNKGVPWKDVKPQEILGINYSSAEGFARIRAQVTEPKKQSGGNGCGLDTVQPTEAPKQQNGCGV